MLRPVIACHVSATGAVLASQQPDSDRPATRLNPDRHHVGASLRAPVTLTEQRAGWAGSRCDAEVDPQPPRAVGSCGNCSADDVEREPWRAAVLDQPGDLMPVNVVGDGLSQRPRDPQPGQLLHSPIMHRVMLADPGMDTADLSSLRMVCFGGAPVAEAFPREAAEHLPGVAFANVWGLTEATSIVTCALGQEWLERPWSVGRPVPGIEVAVAIDEQVAKPDPDAVGELWVRGPAVTAGYWGRPEATAQTFGAGGWLRTGDIGRADAEGYVQVLDRMKDMIIRGGENIYSLEVESVIARHPGVAEVAVVGVPDAVFGERVRAVAVLREGASLPIAALREWAGTRLADYKLPTELITVDELPRNASGKVIKKQLAALLTETPPARASR